MALNFSFLSLRIFFDDLSFYNTSSDAVIYSGNVLSFTLSRAWPVEIALSLFSAIRYNDIHSSSYYPSLFLDLPIISLDSLSFGLRFGALKALDTFSLDSFKNSGTSFFFAIPLRIEDDEIRFGFYLQRDGVYYNLFNENYSPSITEDSFAIFLDSDLNFETFSLNINTFISLSSLSFSLLPENSYFDIASSFPLGDIDFVIGARKQNLFTFEDFINTSDFYIGLGMRTGSIESKMLIRYKKGQPEVALSSSLAFIDQDNNTAHSNRERSGRKIDLKFSLGFENYYSAGLYFSFIPILSFKDASYEVSLRVPLYLEIKERNISLISLKADPWFDMFSRNQSLEDLYDSITDLFALLDTISLGDTDESIFFIRANRRDRRNDIFFENYASFDAISLNAGFNFYNLEFGLYLDDLEAPRILDSYFTFYPFSDDGGSISISLPTEIKIKEISTFDISSFLGLTYNQPFLSGKLNFSFFLYGELSARYINGSPVETNVIYDFERNKLYGYLLGGELRWIDDHFSISLNAGLHSGMIYPNYFNSFSSLNPDINRTGYEIDGLSYYLIFDSQIYFDNVGFLFKYSIPNIVSLAKDRKAYEGDMLTLYLNFILHNGLGLSFSLSRYNFASSIEEISNLYDYFNSENTIYSISLIKEFEDLTLDVSLGTVAIYEESEYMNSYRLKAVSARLKVNARIGF